MGLTVHYDLKTKLTDAREVKKLVRQMRQLALDLPFEEVGEIFDLKGKACDFMTYQTDEDATLRWFTIQAGTSIKIPWGHKLSSVRFNAVRIIGFRTWPGQGCEAANFALCLYPSEIEVEYSPRGDGRFIKGDVGGGSWTSEFSHAKWIRHVRKNKLHSTWPEDYRETRKIPTNIEGWSGGSFCKTQYASSPECGGVPNFLKCHISLITLLERMAKLSDLNVKIEDEGHYGPATYSDDYREADAAGRKRTYVRHKGEYSPASLIKEVADYNEMIAGFFGGLSDVLGNSGLQLEAPIKDYSNFEQLEFRGRKNHKHLEPFLKAVTEMAKKGQTA